MSSSRALGTRASYAFGSGPSHQDGFRLCGLGLEGNFRQSVAVDMVPGTLHVILFLWQKVPERTQLIFDRTLYITEARGRRFILKPPANFADGGGFEGGAGGSGANCST